jgi:hypothetical protein
MKNTVFAPVIIALIIIALSCSGCDNRPLATLPSLCNETAGYPADNDDNYHGPNYFMCVKFTMFHDGYIDAIVVKLTYGSSFRTGLYADSAGQPGARIEQSGQFEGSTGWNEVPLPKTILTHGKTYWIAVDTNGYNIAVYDAGTAGYGWVYCPWLLIYNFGMPLSINPGACETWAGELKIYGKGCF